MVARHGGGGDFSEQPYRWSQRWFEDPPVGTTVNLGGAWLRCMLAAACGSARRRPTFDSLAG
jgi:hypothetical protein